MTKYYIYHIPGVKIGVSVEPKRRISNQGFTEYEILETHNCKYLVSYRERALQKEYGYPVDTTMYYQSKAWRQKGCVNGGKKSSMIAITTGQISNLGKIQGKKNVDNGHLKIAQTKSVQVRSKPVLVYKLDGTFIGEYKSTVECANLLNLLRNKISNVINGKAKQTKGYVIKFKPTAI
jgi:hypothetical protein